MFPIFRLNFEHCQISVPHDSGFPHFQAPGCTFHDFHTCRTQDRSLFQYVVAVLCLKLSMCSIFRRTRISQRVTCLCQRLHPGVYFMVFPSQKNEWPNMADGMLRMKSKTNKAASKRRACTPKDLTHFFIFACAGLKVYDGI